MLPEIADFRGGPKSGDLWAGRLSNAGPRRSAQLVDYPTPLWPETPSKIRDRDAEKRARPAATPRARFFWEGGKEVLPGYSPSNKPVSLGPYSGLPPSTFSSVWDFCSFCGDFHVAFWCV